MKTAVDIHTCLESEGYDIVMALFFEQSNP